MGPEQVLAAIGATGVRARPGTGDDAVVGTVPAVVARPRDTPEVSALLGAAARHGLRVAAAGNGTKRDWGAAPTGCDLLVETGELAGIEHARGDLVVRTGAGAPMDGLRALLGRAGQRLTADPMVPGATVGGTVAAGVSGPLRMLHGPLRDLVIGMTVVRADGVAASSGGVVVKNVAGFDLGKLHTGGWGTLGVITSVTFRLHPVPAAFRLVGARFPDPVAAAGPVGAVLASQAVPAAVELDWPPGGGPVRLFVLVEGAAEGVDARAGGIAALLGARDVRDALPDGWGTLPGEPECTVLKIAAPIRGLPVALTALRAEAGTGCSFRGSAGAGVGYAALPVGTGADRVARVLARTRDALPDGSVTVLRQSPDLRGLPLDRWGEVPGAELMRAVKDRFDPAHRLAPGRFLDH
ncbi:FAD-binding oxidoreductase [Actinorugispora endophytica]|uniref:Glycolate oxidase FAD binding subunit n=1 Tax=Actinorugispora endophytica TaxID=1605990 RepID=A0A4R6UXB4_9ACTN|nr:FAD-binding oxidoreductase [Actinorugispora endophytica]TDQ52085.1 glycolate oxidase FAD binding subunit [Actinorugispora endophytica]